MVTECCWTVFYIEYILYRIEYKSVEYSLYSIHIEYSDWVFLDCILYRIHIYCAHVYYIYMCTCVLYIYYIYYIYIIMLLDCILYILCTYIYTWCSIYAIHIWNMYIYIHIYSIYGPTCISIYTYRYTHLYMCVYI